MSPLVLLLCATASAAETFEGFTWYAGDLHAHTGASGDGGSSDLGRCRGSCGALAELGELAQTAGLDFLAVSDHSNGDMAASASGWDRSLQTLLDADDPEAGFVTIPSAEVWFKTPDGRRLGHRNPLLFGDTDTLRQLTITDLQPGGVVHVGLVECEDIWSWMADLDSRFGPAVLIPHHPAMMEPMAVDWSCHSPTWEPAVEVYSRHGSSMGDGLSMDPPWSGTDPKGTVHHALSEEAGGLQLGFLAGTDSHDTEPGETCDLDAMHGTHPYGGGVTLVVLPEGEPFTRRAIYDAIVDRRTVASTGPLLPVQIEYRSGGALLGGLGEELGLPAGQPLEVFVHVPTDLSAHVLEVTLVGSDGDTPIPAGSPGRWSVELPPEEVPRWVYVRVQISGDSWYGDPGCGDGGHGTTEVLWLSPSWLVESTPDLDGDGVTWADGDCDDGDPDRAPTLPERCGSGLDEDCDGRADQRDGDCQDWAAPTGRRWGVSGTSTLAGRHTGPQHPGGGAQAWDTPARPSACAVAPGSGWAALLALGALVGRRGARR